MALSSLQLLHLPLLQHLLLLLQPLHLLLLQQFSHLWPPR